MNKSTMSGALTLAGLVLAICCVIAWIAFGLNGDAAQAGLGFKGLVIGVGMIAAAGIFGGARR